MWRPWMILVGVVLLFWVAVTALFSYGMRTVHGCPDGGVCGAIPNPGSGACSGEVDDAGACRTCWGEVDDAGACRTIFLAATIPVENPDVQVQWRFVDGTGVVTLLTMNQWDGGRWAVGWNHALCTATVDGGLVCGEGP